MRYAFIVPVMYAIIISVIILKRIEENNIIKKISLATITIIVMINFIGELKFYVFDNYKYVLKDRKINKIKIDGVWGTIGDDSGLTVLVRESNTPIYNLSSEFSATSSLSRKLYYEKISNKKIYILIDPYYKNKDELLKTYGFEVEKLVNKYKSKDITCLSTGHTLYLYRIKYVGVNNEE